MADIDTPDAQGRQCSARPAPAAAASGASGEAASQQEKWLPNALAKWLAAIAQAQSVLSSAQADAGRKIAALQVSIMRAQDELSPENRAGQHALAREIDCGEQLNRAARRLDRLIVDMGCLALAATRLSDIMSAMSAQKAASLVAPAPAARPVEVPTGSAALGRRLAEIGTSVERLGGRTDDDAVAAIWECVLSLQPVVGLLSQHAVTALADLRALTASIDELDREMAMARSM